MIKKLLFSLTLLFGAVPALIAQEAVVTTEPDPLQEDSQNVTIYFHADRGDQGLANIDPATPIYAHTGVDVVSASGKSESWKNAPDWDKDLDKYLLENVGENLWKLYIGNIHDYYDIPAEDNVTRLCFVFRTSKGTKTGRDLEGEDIFVDVLASGFQLDLKRSYAHTLIPKDKKLTFTAATTESASITISINDTPIATASDVTELKGEYTFSEIGNYVVTAQATKADGKNLIKTMDLCVARPSAPASDSTVPSLGMTRNEDGTTTFCFVAPGKETAVLMGSWNGYTATNEQVMDYVDVKDGDYTFRYFKVNVPTETTGSAFSYYFTIDGRTYVSDPYARLVLDPNNDKYISPEVYPDMPQYPDGLPNGIPVAYHADGMLDYKWTTTDFKAPDKDNLVIYELLIRDFTGTEGESKGNGTVRQAMDKIPYLKELGINAVELLPINEFDGNLSWGYNPNFYFAIDKAYGTPQDYKEFIDRCHAEGIAVILDVVFNQSAGLHPWYKLYKIDENPFYNKTAPHAYSVLNDWRQEYPLVQTQWHDMLRFWLEEYKVDGFRFDLVKGLGNNDSYKNSSESATNAFNQSRVDRMKVLHDVMREVNPDAYFINELLGDAKEENEMAKDGELNWSNLNNAGCQFAMGWSSDSNLNGMNAVKYGRTAGSTVAYLESHDEERMAYKQNEWGATGVKGNTAVSMHRLGSAAAQMILAPGAHMLWQFQELGNDQTTKNKNGNDTGNKKVCWSLLDDPYHRGLFCDYVELIGIRLANPDLFAIDNSDYKNICSGWKNGRTIYTTTSDKELYCVINPNITEELTVENVPFRQDNNASYVFKSKSAGSAPKFDAAAKTITVPANCYVVVSTDNVVGVDGVTAEVSGPHVFSLPGMIRIVGATDNAAVWNLDGSLVATLANAEDATIAVPAGMYIVRCGGKVTKLIVR